MSSSSSVPSSLPSPSSLDHALSAPVPDSFSIPLSSSVPSSFPSLEVSTSMDAAQVFILESPTQPLYTTSDSSSVQSEISSAPAPDSVTSKSVSSMSLLRSQSDSSCASSDPSLAPSISVTAPTESPAAQSSPSPASEAASPDRPASSSVSSAPPAVAPVTRLPRGSVSQMAAKFTQIIESQGSQKDANTTPTHGRKISKLDTKTLHAKFVFPSQETNNPPSADAKHARSGSNIPNRNLPQLSSLLASNLPAPSAAPLSVSPPSAKALPNLLSAKPTMVAMSPLPSSPPPPPVPSLAGPVLLSSALSPPSAIASTPQNKRTSLFSSIAGSLSTFSGSKEKDKDKDKSSDQKPDRPPVPPRDPNAFAAAVAAAAAAKARSQTLRRDSAIVMTSAQRAEMSRDDSYSLPAHASPMEFTAVEQEEDEAALAKKQKEEEERKRKEEEEAERLKEQNLSPEQAAAREDMRAKVSGEIISTEQSYIDAIQRVYQHLLLPIKQELGAQWDLSPQIVHDLCSNMEILVQFHSMFIMELTSGKLPIPQVFLKYADYLKMYTQFLSNYGSCMNALTALRNHAKFQSFVKELREKGKLLLDIPSYLIQPVQRVPRYVLLLQELRRHTGPSHPSYEALVEALNKIKVIAAFINEGKRQAENQSKVAEIQSKISGDLPDLVAPSRRLVKEGILTTTSSKGLFGTVKIKANHFYLFNDLLLWVNEHHKFKGSIDLGGAQLDESKRADHLLEISNAKTSITVTFPEENAYNEWNKEIQQQISIIRRTREKITQRQLLQKTKLGPGKQSERESVHSLITQQLAEIANAAQSADSAQPEESQKSVTSESSTVLSPSDSAFGDENNEEPAPAAIATAAPASKKFVVRQVQQRVSRNTLKRQPIAADAENHDGETQ